VSRSVARLGWRGNDPRRLRPEGWPVASNRVLQLTGADMLCGRYAGPDGHQQHVEQLVKSASEWDAFESLLPFWLWRFFYTNQERERMSI
jgi:hypothetical protein